LCHLVCLGEGRDNPAGVRQQKQLEPAAGRWPGRRATLPARGRRGSGPARSRLTRDGAAQARAQRQLGEASRAACAAEDAAPQRRQSLDAACGQGWARLGALGASGLCDLDALSL